MFLHLLKIYLKNLYAPDLFFENFKKGFKSVVKNLFISLIVIYGVAVFTMMLIFMAHGAYNTLSIVERIEYFPAVSIIIAALTIFVFGITSVATSYYSGAGDEQFFAMPLSMKDIFCAKFALSFITDALLGLFVFVIFTGVYAAKEGLLTNPLFYLGVLVTFISFSVLLIALIYIIFIVFLLLFPKLRKKSFLTGLATVQVIVFAAVYSYAIGFGAGSSSVQVTNTSEAFLPLARKEPLPHFHQRRAKRPPPPNCFTVRCLRPCNFPHNSINGKTLLKNSRRFFRRKIKETFFRKSQRINQPRFKNKHSLPGPALARCKNRFARARILCKRPAF